MARLQRSRLILLCTILFFTSTLCYAYAETFLKNNVTIAPTAKPLVLFYSRTGATRTVSLELAKLLSWEVEEISSRKNRHYLGTVIALCCVSCMIEMNPERALPIIDKNIQDAQKHGAEVMVFLCVGCYWLMSGLCEERGLSSLFITDLGRMALGELPFASRPWGTIT